MIENYINKHSIMGMMSKHYSLFSDNNGFYKNKDKTKIVVFDEKYENLSAKEINYYYIFNKPNLPNYHSNLLISNFNDHYFQLKGKEFREIKETRNKWNKSIVIKDDIDNIEDVFKLIEKWDKESGEKYGWQRHSGYDKAFFLKYYHQEKNDLITQFFYCNNELIGYSIVSKITEDNCFRYIIRKMDKSVGRNICLYIDHKTFENIYKLYNKDFFINWGASGGNILKYKKKFPAYKEIKVYFYKKKIS